MLRAPLLVHVRSLQRTDASGAVSRWLLKLLRTRADAIVAIDEAVRRTMPADLPVEIIHNGMHAQEDLSEPDRRGPFCVAIVGVLHRSKGVYELLEAIRLLRDRGTDVRLIIAGENARPLGGIAGWLLKKLDFARDVRLDLERFVARHALEQHVELAGFVRDVRRVYVRADAVCFPSHLDAPGRPVFEAALFGRPTIVAMRNPTSDVIVHGKTGVCIDHPTPETIADAIAKLANDREAAREMGAEARRRALSRFERHVCASKMLLLYERLCAEWRSRGIAAGRDRPQSPPASS
jgi:glycosyltransferase involved in cell wall biosynthesis